MKLVSFGPPGKERPGAIIDDETILDLVLASKGRINTITGLLKMGKSGLEEVLGWLNEIPGESAVVKSQGIRLGPPVTNPSKIVGVGLNYHSHTGEQNIKVPKKPLLFSKAATCLSGDRDPIWYPADDKNVDYEAELAVVIGKPSFRIDPEKWEEHVLGYTIVNDVSGRDAQFGDRKWFRGKSYDSFCPMGPWIVTKDEIPNPHDLNLSAHLNGEVRQESNTRHLIFNIPKLLSFISNNISLQPGDVISTGTPGGVGIFMDPIACMSPGDKIEIRVEKIGMLTNFVQERAENTPSVYPHP